jgi:hypothetical protein
MAAAGTFPDLQNEKARNANDLGKPRHAFMSHFWR